MTSAARVFSDLDNIKPASGQIGGDKDRFPKLPPKSEFLLRIKHCELTEGPDCGDCFVIEHEIVESTSPQALPGQMFVTTITHLLGEHKDLKQGKVRKFIAACFGVDPENPNEKWGELAVYVCEKDTCAGRMVRASTSEVLKSKSKGRPYVNVDFQAP